MYSIVYHHLAAKEIQRQDRVPREQLRRDIEALAHDPDTGKMLKGPLAGLRSHRSGNYRIVYRVFHRELVILVVGIGHRCEIYRTVERR
ncbi:MAG: type II toxin-antitoxin system RelE/ParE family toxin [Planctomycetota bacterium]